MKVASIVSTELKQGVVVARVSAPTVGERESKVITDELAPVLASSGHRLVMDLSQVTMLSSTGLGMLIKLASTTKQGGGGLAIFGLSPALRQMISITKLDKILTLVEGQDAAVQKVSK